MASLDYTSWKTALPREFFQNSIDARAKTIHVTFDGNTVTVVDDGTGMTLDVIQNKLLVLGASGKDAGGAVGAFGKAKELLYFSWPQWSIKTGDLLVEGSGPEYTINRTSSYTIGTVSKITIDDDSIGAMSSYFYEVAQKMDTRTKIYINGDLVESKSRKGRHIKSLPFGELYLNKSINSSYMEVKVQGIWMFSHYLGTSCGQFVLELSKSSIDCLTSNRDDLKWEYRSQLMAFVRDVIANEKTVTTSKKDMVERVITGAGKVRVRPEMMYEVFHNLNTTTAKINFEAALTKLGYNAEILKLRLGNEHQIDQERWSFIGYKPDFELMYTKRQANAVRRFMKQRKALTLANVWTEICKQVILDNSSGYMEFTAGFTFDKDTAACLKKEGSNVSIHINPTLIGKEGGWDKKVLSNRFLLAEELRDKAIHEVAHIKYSDHNENFVAAMHVIRAKTALNFKVYEKIGRMR